MIGKQIRMERIINRETGRTVLVPMDHGVTVGPIEGLIDMKTTVDHVALGGANAIVIHKGLVGSGHRRRGRDVGLIIHLSASTSLSPFPNAKTLVCSVEEAIKLGADAVSIHVNIGNGMEREMLTDLGQVSQEAHEWGMPLLAMIYPRGERIKDEYDPKVIKHAARLGAELGADIVKVSYTGSVESFRAVIAGCPVPVVIAGGPKMNSDRDILEMVKGSVEAGGSGVSIGRNVFQHREPSRMVGAISLLVHENSTVDEALSFLQTG
ncbi:MAG: fructose-bisphosphate aldolase [Desulfobacca sp. 4484_104]|nr:MAG: fructose-bisphosphate aldolase [Desulfobacca sp. 4484_104]RLA90414.1 MAG: fructose-bisphosphate aldolase [Deltaproteobacteria bacterium]